MAKGLKVNPYIRGKRRGTSHIRDAAKFEETKPEPFWNNKSFEYDDRAWKSVFYRCAKKGEE